MLERIQDRKDRAHVVRNATRLPFLAALLIYAQLPYLGAGASRVGPIIMTAPGPWAPAAAGIGCALGVLIYSLAPLWRPYLRPNRTLTDVHFYGTAAASCGLFWGRFGAGADSIFVKDPAGVERIAAFITLTSVSGWLLAATTALPVVQFALFRRQRAASP